MHLTHEPRATPASSRQRYGWKWRYHTGVARPVLLGYPQVIARCSSSSLMPQPYWIRGGWRATFAGAVLEYTMHAASIKR